jgi:Spy/CpxP family protein refolding chaperone
MTKMKWFGFAATLVTLLGTYPLAAQTASSPLSPRGTTPTHKQPCWQQAGVSQSAMQQRKQIEENTHSQIEAVCSDSSLAPQQKQQKIQQLHQEAQKQVGGLITPQQEAAIKSCRESRGEGPHMSGVHSGGPCGEMTSTGNKP